MSKAGTQVSLRVVTSDGIARQLIDLKTADATERESNERRSCHRFLWATMANVLAPMVRAVVHIGLHIDPLPLSHWTISVLLQRPYLVSPF